MCGARSACLRLVWAMACALPTRPCLGPVLSCAFGRLLTRPCCSQLLSLIINTFYSNKVRADCSLRRDADAAGGSPYDGRRLARHVTCLPPHAKPARARPPALSPQEIFLRELIRCVSQQSFLPEASSPAFHARQRAPRLADTRRLRCHGCTQPAAPGGRDSSASGVPASLGQHCFLCLLQPPVSNYPTPSDAWRLAATRPMRLTRSASRA